MSIYRISKLKRLNDVDSATIHENYQPSPASRQLISTKGDVISTFGTIDPNNYKLIEFNKKMSVGIRPGINEAETIRLTQDASAIRQNGYLYYDDKFKPGLPYNTSYVLCPQKLSTVFSNSSKFYSSSYDLNEISYKTEKIVSITEANALVANYTTSDCICFVNEYTGNYYLDWSSSEAKLINTDNGNVSDVSFDFYSSEEFFEIKIYPTSGTSYLWIRYRIPVRYRYAYLDWVFMENLVINGEMSETEFVKIVNCCETDASVLSSI